MLGVARRPTTPEAAARVYPRASTERRPLGCAHEWHWMFARQLRDHIAARDVSPIEVMEELLRRVERLGPVLSPFMTVETDRARRG